MCNLKLVQWQRHRSLHIIIYCISVFGQWANFVVQQAGNIFNGHFQMNILKFCGRWWGGASVQRERICVNEICLRPWCVHLGGDVIIVVNTGDCQSILSIKLAYDGWLPTRPWDGPRPHFTILDDKWMLMLTPSTKRPISNSFSKESLRVIKLIDRVMKMVHLTFIECDDCWFGMGPCLPS